MNDSERAPYSAGAWAVGWVTFLGSGYAASVLLSNAWHDCDIGINASANLGDLVMASTSMAMASTLLWGLMRKVTGRRQLLLPLLMTVAAAAALLWPLMAIWHAPDGYPVSFCVPDNVPPWWPDWLPV
ncbi:hypothetical protein ACWDR2_04730 [Streptomyces sp. NPDC003631]|uniref:Integral membrane protein n=1 Tax=Streptomyces lannensis TaxID=766498 RepID=A0ABP7K3J1_9ACTN|nr:hypothetical protein [Streptomyces sp. WAC07094]